MRIILFVLFACSGTFAKEMEDRFRVIKIQKNKTSYEIQFNESAPIYKANKEIVKCLGKSLKNKEFVKVKYETRNLEIKECYALNDSTK